MTVLELNYWIALGTVLMQIASVLLLVLFFLRKSPVLEPLAKLVGNWGIAFSFIITGFGIVLSLVYSEYFGILPCGLCWLQRVFLYPQIILFAIAFFIRDTRVALYSIGLSVFGAVIALYQHYLQMGGNDLLPCPATGDGDCAKRFLFEFGYVTFPLVAFSSFVFLIVLMLFVYARSKNAD